MEPRSLIARTRRLCLRELTVDDLDAMCAFWTDPDTLVHWPKTPTRQDVTGIIARQLMSYVANGFGAWAVESLGDGRLIGDCGLWAQQLDGAPVVELGYHFRRDVWGNGYASEAARAALAQARARGIERVHAFILPANLESQRVARAIGMRVVGQTTHVGLAHDVWATEG
jgi:[ribosomal protein S5]-alanine N-acetyltransferase